MYMLAAMVVIILQCISVSNQHVSLHNGYLNYNSTELKKERAFFILYILYIEHSTGYSKDILYLITTHLRVDIITFEI